MPVWHAYLFEESGQSCFTRALSVPLPERFEPPVKVDNGDLRVSADTPGFPESDLPHRMVRDPLLVSPLRSYELRGATRS